MPQTLYDTIRSQRENEQHQSRLFNRVMIAGYLHEQNCKKNNLDPQKMVKQSIIPYRQQNKISGYLYVKGYFYINILQSVSIDNINNYLKGFYSLIKSGKYSQSHKQIRIVYQGYQQQQSLFKGYECDNSSQQSGPILIETDKLEEQILQRSIEIYQFFQQGAKTKKTNPAHRIGNMILLNNDDMSLLISKQFMNLEEYLSIYCEQIPITKENDLNYPMPPNMFKMIEFVQIGQNYQSFAQ